MTAVIRFRVAAFLMAGNCLLAFVAFGLLVYSLMTYDRAMTIFGSGLLVILLLLIVIQWMAANGAWCPLCRTAVLSPMRCAKHRKARTLLGSHRLRVAAAILFKNRFRCPYCNEPTALEVRETIDRSRERKTQMH